jgi:DNA-3-methyladenine glycosylase
MRPADLAYVYFIYGMHYCLNVVTEAQGFPAAVLLRGILPLEGIDLMTARRPGQALRSLANGPAKLCQALAIDRRLDRHDLTQGVELWLEPGEPVRDDRIVATSRVNVSGDHRARTVLWRWAVR